MRAKRGNGGWPNASKRAAAAPARTAKSKLLIGAPIHVVAPQLQAYDEVNEVSNY